MKAGAEYFDYVGAYGIHPVATLHPATTNGVGADLRVCPNKTNKINNKGAHTGAPLHWHTDVATCGIVLTLTGRMLIGRMPYALTSQCDEKTKGLRVKPAMTPSIIVMCVHKQPAMTALWDDAGNCPLSRIPLGTHRSVENTAIKYRHAVGMPPKENKTISHEVAYLTTCGWSEEITFSTERFIPNGMKKNCKLSIYSPFHLCTFVPFHQNNLNKTKINIITNNESDRRKKNSRRHQSGN